MSSYKEGGVGWDGACGFHGHRVVQQDIQSDVIY